MKPILSLRDLSWRLGIPIDQLREVADKIESHYTIRPHWDEKKQKVRHFRVPSQVLKGIQRRLNTKVFAPIGVGEEVHGGVRGRSARSNATEHLGQPCVVNLDVKDFFPSIRHYVVYRMFRRELGFGRDVARLLTRLTTLHSQAPQGAPTSVAIANLLLAAPVDRLISAEAGRIGVRNTRFIDDITLSGINPRPLISRVGKMLSQRRLPMYRKRAKGRGNSKLKITPRSRPQEVTGLLVNLKSGPSVSRGRRDKIRAAIFSLGASADQAVLRAEATSIRGRIAHVSQFNPGPARRLKRYLESTIAGR